MSPQLSVVTRHVCRFLVGVGASRLITGYFRPALVAVTAAGMGVGFGTKVCKAARVPTERGDKMYANYRPSVQSIVNQTESITKCTT